MTTALMAPNVKKVSDLLFENKEQFARLLSKSVDPQKFLSVVVTCFQDNPDLHNCSQTSMVKFALQCARMDMMPGPMRLCYPVPYKNHGKLEVSWQLGYKGAIELCWRSGQLNKIAGRPVFEGDEFKYEYGLEETMTHKPTSEWHSKAWEEDKTQKKAWEHLTHVYAFAKLKNGEKSFVVLTKAQCSWHRDRYSKAATNGPWVSNPIEMSVKTALIELANLLPASQTDNRMAVAVGWEKQAQGEQAQTLDVPFEITGLDEELQQEQKPASPSLPNFGDHAGKSVDDPSVPIEGDYGLTFYLTYLKDGLDKKGREKFREHNLATIAAIEAELVRRQPQEPTKQAENRTETAQGDAETPEQVESGTEPSREQEPELIGDDRWGAILKYMQSKKPLSAIRDIVKAGMGVKLLSNLEPHERGKFMALYESEAVKQGQSIKWPMV